MKSLLTATLAVVVSVQISYAEMLPASDDRLLVEADLVGMTSAELRVARNEIFARHGYAFNSNDLRDHFSQYSWYNPTGKNVTLSQVEQKNVAFIKSYEGDPALIRALQTQGGGFYVTPEVPVMIVREDDLDPCAVGIISGLDPNGDGFLSVRSGPDADYTEIDRLYNGDQVRLCDGDGGNWSGIVYVPRGEQTCSTNDFDFTYPYQGTCSSGWIFGRYVSAIAG